MSMSRPRGGSSGGAARARRIAPGTVFDVIGQLPKFLLAPTTTFPKCAYGQSIHHDSQTFDSTAFARTYRQRKEV